MSRDFVNVMKALSPVGWWRLGEREGNVARDVIGHHDGTYTSEFGLSRPRLGLPGAISSDPDTAAEFNSDLRQLVWVPPNDLFSLVRACDEFSKIWPATWGYADHGGQWIMEVGTDPIEYRTEGGHAIIVARRTGTWQMGLPVQLADGNVQVEATWGPQPQDHYISPVAIVARRQDADNYYRAILRENADHSLSLAIVKTAGGTSTTLGLLPNIGSYYAGDWWVLRLQLDGPNLRARAWNRNAMQPTYWVGPQALSVSDTTFQTGTIALRASNSGSGHH